MTGAMPELYDTATRILNKVIIVVGECEVQNLMLELKERGGFTISFVNAHGFNLCCDEESVLEDFLAIDVLLRDGRGMEILLHALGWNPGINMNGTDFIPMMLEVLKGRGIAVFGTEDPWLSLGSEELAGSGHSIVARCDGFRDEQAYISLVHEAKPEVVLLAMGMPKQERLARRLRSEFPDDRLIIICGGAVIDFISHRFPRAPHWVRSVGLEWMFRLMREPRRLFYRYTVGNIFFLARVLYLVLRNRIS